MLSTIFILLFLVGSPTLGIIVGRVKHSTKSGILTFLVTALIFFAAIGITLPPSELIVPEKRPPASSPATNAPPTQGKTPAEPGQTPATPTQEDKTEQALNDLINKNKYVTGYDFETFDLPAVIVDYDKIAAIIKAQDFNAFSKLYEDLDEIGVQMTALGYPKVYFAGVENGENMRFATYELGSTFFNEDFAFLGVRVRHGDLVIQSIQMDNSGYFPAIIGLIYNAGQRDLGNVYIEFNLKNENDSIIGFTNDNIGSLKSGQKWQFRCEVVQEISYFEISKILY